jgi:hypothetical protein
MSCDHSGPHSGALQYEQNLSQLRLLLVCDRCGAERGELGRLDYRPDSVIAGVPAGEHESSAR